MDSNPIRQQLRDNVPPPMREAYDKLVTAGMKFMFDEKTHHYVIEHLQGEGDAAQKLGEGVAALMVFLAQQSQGAFPSELVIPAGIELTLHAAEFGQESGLLELTPQTLGDAIQVMIFKLLGQNGMSEDQIMAAFDETERIAREQPQAQPGAEPGMPPPGTEPQGQPPRGLLMGG